MDMDARYEAAFRQAPGSICRRGPISALQGRAGRTTPMPRRGFNTATHLLQRRAARAAVGRYRAAGHGSNITPERLRFDFNFPRKVEPGELARIEEWVNAAIAADVPVTCDEMSVEAAQNTGAVGVFGSRYGDVVKVFTMGDYSREICGGPHAARTGELGVFKIQKEQAVSAGVRRIRAILSNPEQ